jgi:DNA-binding winged helix-turn-helix (wHTH) protein/cytochrome c-type biogenesis protein CcmH/NrfG
LLRFTENVMTSREVFSFGEFTLDAGERRLLRGTEPVRLSPKAHDVLVALVRQSGRLVTKDELLARVWPEAFVEEGILTVHISALRKALGGDKQEKGYIETVSRLGYRFIAPVTNDARDDEKLVLQAASRPIELYEFVGRGRTHLLSASYFEVSDAVSSFQAAIDLDPTYAPAHAGLALARCAQANFRVVPHRDAYAEAKASALRALAMDSASADAQVALGTVLFLSEWDWGAAERSLRRALEISPGHSEALLQYGSLIEALGKLDEGLQFKQQALERDPKSPLVLVQIAWSYWHQRKYDDAITWASRAIDIDPRQLLAGEFLAAAYWKQGNLDGLLEESIRRAIVFGVPDAELARLKRTCAEMQTVHASRGHKGLTEYILEHLPQGEAGALLVQRAILYGAAGRLGAAFENLDRAIAVRDPGLVHLAVAPQWDSLRDDERFRDRLKQMSLPYLAQNTSL